MKNQILLVLAVVLVACSQSGTPSPTQAALDAAIVAHVATLSGQPMCGAVPCPDPGVVQNPNVKAMLDARTPAQIAAAACRGSDGIWHCGDRSNKNGQLAQPLMASGNATAAQCGPACTVGAWWFDPANTTGCASDSNSGTSATCSGAGIGPLATFAQFIQRVGSTIPQYPAGQGVSVTQMSAQAANTDMIFFEPRMSSTTASQATAIFTVTPLAVGVPQAITVNTAKTRGAPGTLLTLTNPVGIAAEQLVVNTTAGRLSQAIVDSVGATTVMQEPQTTASLTNTAVIPTPTVDDGWITTNVVQLYTLQNSNLQRWNPVGGNVTSANAPTSGFVFYASIADSSGTGVGIYPHGCTSASNALVNCVVHGRLHVSSESGRGDGAYIVGTSVVGQCNLENGPWEILGGGFASGINVEPGAGSDIVTQDAILHSNSSFLANASGIQNAYSDGSVTVQTAFFGISGAFWGSYSIDSLGMVYNTGGSGWAAKALLTTGTVEINTIATGYSFTAASGIWGTGTALTPGDLDSAPGNSLYGQGGAGGYVTLGF